MAVNSNRLLTVRGVISIVVNLKRIRQRFKVGQILEGCFLWHASERRSI